MNIHEITSKAGRHKRRKRVGRGESSGTGKTLRSRAQRLSIAIRRRGPSSDRRWPDASIPADAQAWFQQLRLSPSL